MPTLFAPCQTRARSAPIRNFIRYSKLSLKLLGLVLLALYFSDHPFELQPLMVAIYLAIFVGITLIHVFVVKPIVDEIKRVRLRHTPEQYAQQERRAVRQRFQGLFKQLLRRPLLNLLLAVGEDGLFLVPLLWYGVDPLSAAIAAGAFGAMHYPKYSPLQCVSKTLAYYLACLIVLPHGLFNMLLGHVLLDSFALALAWRRTQRDPTAAVTTTNA